MCIDKVIIAIAMIAMISATGIQNAPVVASASTIEGETSAENDAYADVGEVFVLSLGGKVYDDLWIMTGAKRPERDNPAFPIDAKRDLGTWRCVSCHGWDYKGGNGERGTEGGSSNFADLTQLRGEDTTLIASKILEKPHDYDPTLLNDFALEVLAIFVSAGQYPVEIIIDDRGIANGDPKNGQAVYEGACMNCHEIDGRGYLKGERGDKSSLGWIARNRPEQAIHKILNGVPGSYMLAMRFLTLDATADLMTYLQTLDAERD